MERNKIAEGNTAELFEVSDTRVLKLFKIGYSKGAVEQEYRNHRTVSAVVKNVPALFEFVEVQGRFGFVMEKIQGESLAAKMMDGDSFDQAMDLFVELHTSWLQNRTETAVPYTEWMLCVLQGMSGRERLKARIERLPQGGCLCHGDFHPYNIIISSVKKPIIIDFANVCKAPREYDVARTYYLLKEAVPENPVAERYRAKMQVDYDSLREYLEVLEGLRESEKSSRSCELFKSC